MPTLAGNDRNPVYVVELQVLGTSASAGVIGAIDNPAGEPIIIMDSWIDIATGSTGASTLDIGVAANRTTLGDNLIDGISGQTAGILNTRGTNGGALRRWAANQVVTISEASGDVNGLNATVYVKYCLA